MKNKSDLYQSLYPALTAKRNLLNKFGYNNIDEKLIWDYLWKNVWLNEQMNISEMTNDILNTPNYLFNDYIKEYLACNKNSDESLL